MDLHLLGSLDLEPDSGKKKRWSRIQVETNVDPNGPQSLLIAMID
jgi:hypothetical protein